MASIKDIRAKLLKNAAPRPVKSGAGDPVENFIARAKEQIANIEVAIKKRDNGQDFREDFNSRKDWYVAIRGGYGLSFGKFRPNIDGEDYFKLADLEEVKEYIEGAIQLAEDDKDFIAQIEAASDKLKATLASGKTGTSGKKK